MIVILGLSFLLIYWLWRERVPLKLDVQGQESERTLEVDG